MSEPPKLIQDDAAPTSFANVPPPRDLHSTSDIRFVISELSKYGERVDRLIKDVEKLGEKIEKHSDLIQRMRAVIDRFVTGAIVASFILSAVGAIFWWAIGDRITSAVHAGLGEPAQPNSSAPPLPAKTSPAKNSN